MINEDTPTADEFEHVDSFDDLNDDSADASELHRVASFDDLSTNDHASAELEQVDSFGDLDDDLDIQTDTATAPQEPVAQEPVSQEPVAQEPVSSDNESGLLDFPTVAASAPADTPKEVTADELVTGFNDAPAESESAAASEEISIAGESESAAVSEELEEVGAGVRLVITPSPELLITGQQISFSVEAFDKDNNPVQTPTVKWTARGGDITRGGVYTVGRSTGLFSVKASTRGVSERVEGMIEAAPSRNEWVLASFFSACGIYLALAVTYFLDPAVLGPAKNFIGYFDLDWAIATILVGPCLICFISSSLGLLSKPKGKEWLLLLPSFGPVVPVVLGAISVMSFF